MIWLRSYLNRSIIDKLQFMRAKLQGIKEGEHTAYSHLVSVLKEIVLNNDQDGYQLFEYYSQHVKNNEQSHSQFRLEETPLLQEYITKGRALLNKINVGTEEEPQEPGPCGYLPNLMEEAKIFEKAGVGFGEETTYLIFKAL